jgi:hypothetical protein
MVSGGGLLLAQLRASQSVPTGRSAHKDDLLEPETSILAGVSTPRAWGRVAVTATRARALGAVSGGS